MTIDDLRTALTGPVYADGDDDFPALRAGHSRRDAPDIVVRALNAGDVVAAVRWAAAEGLPFGVRCGGHSQWGSLPGGLIVDLRDLNGIEVAGDIVRIGGGATWGQIAHTLGARGLVVSSGDTASVGVGGLTLGGGVGWMVRLWGLALDQLIGVEVVTARGDVVTASADEHPDLFWAIRGGGGNFGVVTRFDFRAHRLPSIVSGVISFAEDADPAALLRAWRDVMRDAPEELNTTYLAMPPMGMPGPAGPSILVCYAGADEAAAAIAIAPLLQIPGLASSDISPRPYADILEEQEVPEELPAIVDGNGFVADFSDRLIDDVVAAHRASFPAVLMVRYLRGAFNRVPADATAFGLRTAETLVISAAFLPPEAPETESTRLRAAWDVVGAQTLGMYSNFIFATDGQALPRIYPADTLARLRAVKRTWDPGNLFGRNHNIAP